MKWKTDDVLDLLAGYDWIFNFQLTNYLTERVWERVPEEVRQCVKVTAEYI